MVWLYIWPFMFGEWDFIPGVMDPFGARPGSGLASWNPKQSLIIIVVGINSWLSKIIFRFHFTFNFFLILFDIFRFFVRC